MAGHCCPPMPLDLYCRPYLEPFCTSKGAFIRLIGCFQRCERRAWKGVHDAHLPLLMRVSDLAEWGEQDLLRVPNFGRGSLSIVRHWIALAGLTLKGSSFPKPKRKR